MKAVDKFEYDGYKFSHMPLGIRQAITRSIADQEGQ